MPVNIPAKSLLPYFEGQTLKYYLIPGEAKLNNKNLITDRQIVITIFIEL